MCFVWNMRCLSCGDDTDVWFVKELQLVVDVGVDVDCVPACMLRQVPASDNSTIVSGTVPFYAGTSQLRNRMQIR